MLNIINSLSIFFEDCYRRVNVREYSRLTGISPPTASKILLEYHKEGLLLLEKDRNYQFYYANKENKDFRNLSLIYWNNKLKNFIDYLKSNHVNPTIILFGSLSKSEAKIDSDVDIAIISLKKEIDISKFEKEIKRNIQLFYFSSINDIKNKELRNNILNGYVIEGKIRL